MTEVVDDLLVGDVVDVLQVYLRLGRIGLLLRISGVDVLQNVDATRGHSLRNVHYRKTLRDKPPF